MELTREQRVVDTVAREINGGDLLLSGETMEEKAGVLVVVRQAYKSGQNMRYVDGANPLLVTKEALYNMCPSNNGCRVFERAYDYVASNQDLADLAIWAFEQGQEKVTSGVGER
jgi:hypothetical protein